MKKRILESIVVSFLLIFLTLVILGCGTKTQTSTQASQELEGTIRVSGAWALYPMMVKWAEEFQKVNPKVRVEVSAGGAGKGATDALGGLVDIGMISREITKEEIDKGAYFIPVVKDAVFVGVNEKNPAWETLSNTGLKKQAFIDMWIAGKAVTWGGLIGTSLKDKINVYTRSDSCGAADTWAKYLGKKQEDLKGTGVYGDPGIAEAVKKDIYGIGYNNLNYAYDLSTGLPVAGLKIIPIDVNENGKVDPEEDISTKEKAIKAIIAKSYPSPPARDLYIMTKGSFSGLNKEFVKWILADGQKYVDETGYIKLTDAQITEAKAKVG